MNQLKRTLGPTSNEEVPNFASDRQPSRQSTKPNINSFYVYLHCRNIDQANLPPPSGLMPRFGRPWMVKKSVNPLRTMQGSQLSGATATEATADGPELRLQSSLDSAAVGRPVTTPCDDPPTQEGFVPRVSTRSIYF